MLRKLMIAALTGAMVFTTAAAAFAGEVQEEKAVKKVYTINHIYGDGQKVSAVVLEYSSEIDPESLSADAFEVEKIAGAFS